MCSDSTVQYKILFDDNPSKAIIIERYTTYLEAVAVWILRYPWYREQFNLRLVSKASLSYIGSRLLSSAADAWNSACQGDVVTSRKWRNALKLGETIFSTPVNTSNKKNAVLQPKWPRLRSYQGEVFRVACTFNRCQYARLRSAPMPVGVGFAGQAVSAADRVAMELGAKLCAGLDILLLSASHSGANTLPAECLQNSSTGMNQSVMAFCDRLMQLGFFKGNVEGSRRYQELQQQAKAFYCENLPVKTAQCSEPSSLLHTFVNQLEKQVDSPDGTLSGWLVEDLRSTEASGSCPPADDESWMVISPEELDVMFANHQEAATSADQSQQLASVTSRLQRFLKSKSSYKGVETRSFISSASKRKQRVTAGASDSSTDEEFVPGNSSKSKGVPAKSRDLEGFDSDEAMDDYLECPTGDDTAVRAIGDGDSQLGMADMMRSLVLEIDQIAATSRKTAKSSQLTVQADIYSSDDEELPDLYGPDTDLCKDYLSNAVQLPSSASLSSASDSPQVSPRLRRRRVTPPPREQQQSRGKKETLSDVLRQQTGKLASGSENCSALGEMPLVVEERTSSSTTWKASGPSQVADRDSDGEETSGASLSSSFDKYLRQMEQELSGQPANAGRVAPQVGQQLTRDQQGVSVSKKTRRVRLAQVEEDEMQSSSEEVEDGEGEGEAGVAVADHVLTNLCSSALGRVGSDWVPGGPAAQLFTSLGIPVHRLASMGRVGDQSRTGAPSQPPKDIR